MNKYIFYNKYSEILYWTVHGNTNEFYYSMKCKEWDKIVQSTDFD